MMQRETVLAKYEAQIINAAAERFELNSTKMEQFEAYEGCENLVYACQRHNQPVILRVSYRPDRSYGQIVAEIDFIRFLCENGVRAAEPLPSAGGEFIEKLEFGDLQLHLVCFERGRGMRVPDNGYRYREDAPIEEYFQNWGAILGQMHALSQQYSQKHLLVSRPDWFVLHRKKLDLEAIIPQALPRVKQRIQQVLGEVHALPKEKSSYGLIHGDFNDGNFTVDYSNGDITVFDFDDSCTFWFAYELAAAWEGGIGRVMFDGLKERKKFMAHYMNQVLLGYSRENQLSAEWIEKIPLFIRLIQVEELLHYLRYFEDGDAEIQSHLSYLVTCVEEDLPYMGFFDPIYSPEQPFAL